MNVLIYGSKKEKEHLVEHIKNQACMAFRLVTYFHAEDYETYLIMLREQPYDMVFVLADNAVGMEGVIAVQNVQPETPIVWFSNDKNFVAQSYRLGVNYFAVKPVDEKIVNLALKRCQRREDVAI